MGVKICPNCGGKVSDSRNECIHCKYIFPLSKKCPDCNENVDLKVNECPICGHIFNIVSKCEEKAIKIEETKETVEVYNTESIQTQIDKVICPYCFGEEVNSIGVDYYMCMTCKNKFLDRGNIIPLENVGNSLDSTPQQIDNIKEEKDDKISTVVKKEVVENKDEKNLKQKEKDNIIEWLIISFSLFAAVVFIVGIIFAYSFSHLIPYKNLTLVVVAGLIAVSVLNFMKIKNKSILIFLSGITILFTTNLIILGCSLLKRYTIAGFVLICCCCLFEIIQLILVVLADFKQFNKNNTDNAKYISHFFGLTAKEKNVNNMYLTNCLLGLAAIVAFIIGWQFCCLLGHVHRIFNILMWLDILSLIAVSVLNFIKIKNKLILVLINGINILFNAFLIVIGFLNIYLISHLGFAFICCCCLSGIIQLILVILADFKQFNEKQKLTEE